MRLKLGILLLLSLMVSTMRAQTPTAVQDIYSQSRIRVMPKSDALALTNFGSWHAGDKWSALFDEILSDKSATSVDGLVNDAEGIQLNWDSVNKLLTVVSESSKLGRTSVLIAEMNGATRDVVSVNESPATISLADYTAGIYALAVAVDGKLVKTLKINLK